MSNLSVEEQKEYLQIACQVARNSPDPSTQNGSVLVKTVFGNTDKGFNRNPTLVASGYNTYPTGVGYGDEFPERMVRPLKYAFIEHAERNSLFDAARFGIQTQGLIMVCPWAACSDCARAIIQCGIHELITLKPEQENDRWDDSIKAAMTMLSEAGVEVTYYEGQVFDAHDHTNTLRRNGEVWKP